MPITIVPPAPGGIGPGLLVQLNSDFVGPLPSGSTFQLNLVPQGHENALIWSGVQVTDRKTSEPQIGLPFEGWQWIQPGQGTIQPGQPCTIDVTLNEPGVSTPIDSGSLTVPWDPVTGLPLMIQPTGGGTLTPEQAQQLQDLHDSVAGTVPIDDLELTELGPPDGAPFVAAQLPSAIWGIIVRVITIPPELTTIGADANYWRTTLASVQVFRGQDLWLRAPVHTPSRIIPLHLESFAALASHNDLTAWLLQMSVQVTCFPGVTVRVFNMLTP